MKKAQKVIDPQASADAVLSQSPPQQVNDLTAGECDAFNQAHDHPHVGQHRRTGHARLVQHHLFPLQCDRRRQWCAGRRGAGMPAGRSRLRRRRLRIVPGLRLRARRGLAALAAGIQPLLLPLPGRRPVVRGAPLAGTLPAMVLPAAERAPQVPPTRIARMREKANPALRAGNGTPAKLGMGLQDRVQRGLILPDKRPGPIVLVPIRTKREELLDGDGKKARLSAILAMVVCTPSSYLFDANASRGRARFFVRNRPGTAKTVRADSASPIACPDHSPYRAGAVLLRVTSSNHYLKEGSPLLLPSSMAI